MIYHYAVVHNAPLRPVLGGQLSFDEAILWNQRFHGMAVVRPIEPALSKVCHQLRTEVLPMFYGENIWTWMDYVGSVECRDFILALTPAKRMMLRTVHFEDAGTSCVHHKKIRMGKWNTWLKANNIRLVAGAVQVRVWLSANDCDEIWTSEPTGECKISACKHTGVWHWMGRR